MPPVQCKTCRMFLQPEDVVAERRRRGVHYRRPSDAHNFGFTDYYCAGCAVDLRAQEVVDLLTQDDLLDGGSALDDLNAATRNYIAKNRIGIVDNIFTSSPFTDQLRKKGKPKP